MIERSHAMKERDDLRAFLRDFYGKRIQKTPDLVEGAVDHGHRKL